MPGPESGPEPIDPIEDFWGFDEPPPRRRREPMLRLVAQVALVAFLIAFPLGIVVDSFYRSSFPEASLAAVEVVLVGALALWLRGVRRRR